jgi:hypothetical protein
VRIGDSVGIPGPVNEGRRFITVSIAGNRIPSILRGIKMSFMLGFAAGMVFITIGFFIFDRLISSKEFLTAEEKEKREPGWKYRHLQPESNSVIPAVAYEIRKEMSKRGEKSINGR